MSFFSSPGDIYDPQRQFNETKGQTLYPGTTRAERGNAGRMWGGNDGDGGGGEGDDEPAWEITSKAGKKKKYSERALRGGAVCGAAAGARPGASDHAATPFKDAWHELYKGNSVKRKDRNHCVGLKTHVGWHWTWMGSDELIRNKVVSCIETQHRDPEEMLQAFKRKDTIAAINHKATTHVVDTRYPDAVQAILKRYPSYWHNPPQD